MTAPEYPIQVSCINSSFNAFHELVKAWEIDFIQLGNGQFKSDLHQAIYPNIQLASVRFNSAVKQEGFSPAGFWSFAFVNDKQLHWRNYLIEPHSIIIYAPNSKINAVSLPGFEVSIISISEQHLMKFCSDLGLDFHATFKELLLVKPEQKGGDKFNTLISDLAKKPSSKEPINLIQPLIELVLASTPYLNEISSESRLELLSNAETYIHKNVKNSLTVSKVARECLVSERALLYAFKQRFGVGPKAFIKIIKLNQVYQRLCTNNDGDSISKIARSFGFWHMGQFHADYKTFFGELPSETVVKTSNH